MARSELVTGTVMDAWRLLLRAHSVITCQLDRELRRCHDLTLSDYDVLVQLRDAGSQQLRMIDLSRRTLLTKSGMTRLVDGLARDGLVERRSCPGDARVSYAQLTEEGRRRLAEARATHHDGIRRVFADHFDEEQAAELASLLRLIPGAAAGPRASADDEPCCDAP